MQSEPRQFFCSHCHQIGGTDQFDFQNLSYTCSILTCLQCQKKTGASQCSDCKKINFVDADALLKSQPLQCSCKCNFQLLPCGRCETLLLITEKRALTQIVVLCSSCNQQLRVRNCPICKSLLQVAADKASRVWNCRCSTQFTVTNCTFPNCQGEMTQVNGEAKYVCLLDPQHRYESFFCAKCKNENYFANSDHRMKCQPCGTEHVRYNCQRCHHQSFANVQSAQVNCQKCTQAHHLTMCMDCKLGCYLLDQDWINFVNTNKSKTPSAFLPLSCSNIKCKGKQTVFFCKKCSQFIIHRGQDIPVQCGKCKQPFEPKPTETRADACVICQDRQCVMMPPDCRHLCLCQECEITYTANQAHFKKCPICKGPAQNFIRVFRS